MSEYKHGLSDISCNRCNAGLMDNFVTIYKCSVCGQIYNIITKKYGTNKEG